MSVYGTLENLHEKVAIHINDTHPTLAIPELMRILLDDCGYTWDKAWHIVKNTFAYTNHTVMAEALEKWDVNLLKNIVPRIFSIIVEINNRYCSKISQLTENNYDKTSRMSIIKNNTIHMASLCVAASHSVNGVSKLHSEIIKQDVFADEYQYYPHKFKNVTNGIAYRRWLYQSNPGLTQLLRDKIGPGFLKNADELKKFSLFAENNDVLDELAKIKRSNKETFLKYAKNYCNLDFNIDPDSIFDVQVKRLHEYKRQHLNALNIIADYNYLLANPDADFVPRTYIFAAKAAPGYYLAKQIIKMIWSISQEIRKNPKISQKLNVFFLEDYKVTLSELLMPASDISEQISLAGTEASGTGNMKLMLNGAVTLGTLDGANIEIKDAAGDENIIIFGMTAEEVNAKKASGYNPRSYYDSDETIRQAVNHINTDAHSTISQTHSLTKILTWFSLTLIHIVMLRNVLLNFTRTNIHGLRCHSTTLPVPVYLRPTELSATTQETSGESTDNNHIKIKNQGHYDPDFCFYLPISFLAVCSRGPAFTTSIAAKKTASHNCIRGTSASITIAERMIMHRLVPILRQLSVYFAIRCVSIILIIKHAKYENIVANAAPCTPKIGISIILRTILVPAAIPLVHREFLF